MTDLEAKRIDNIIERMKAQHEGLSEHETKLRKAFVFAVNELAKQDPETPGAFMPSQYLDAVEASLPRKEEEPSDVLSRGSSLP